MSSMRETLAEEAAQAEERRDDPPGRMHRTRASGGSSQVYTLRMPADRLAELRAIAEQFGEQPSTLMRRWVLERLDIERTSQPNLTDVRRTLADALRTLDQVEKKRGA